MPTILVIDDDPHMGLILTHIFNRHGFVVRVATDGASGLQEARDQRPDLILLDIMQPGMDGLEVARRLQQDPECARIPILFLTAVAAARGRQAVEGVGAKGLISKPFEVDEMVAQVKALIDHSDALGGQ